MGIPADKISRSRRGMRRSHHALKAPGVSSCPQCNAIMRPHRVCRECGYYRGKEVVTPKS